MSGQAGRTVRTYGVVGLVLVVVGVGLFYDWFR